MPLRPQDINWLLAVPTLLIPKLLPAKSLSSTIKIPTYIKTIALNLQHVITLNTIHAGVKYISEITSVSEEKDMLPRSEPSSFTNSTDALQTNNILYILNRYLLPSWSFTNSYYVTTAAFGLIEHGIFNKVDIRITLSVQTILKSIIIPSAKLVETTVQILLNNFIPEPVQFDTKFPIDFKDVATSGLKILHFSNIHVNLGSSMLKITQDIVSGKIEPDSSSRIEKEYYKAFIKSAHQYVEKEVCVKVFGSPDGYIYCGWLRQAAYDFLLQQNTTYHEEDRSISKIEDFNAAYNIFIGGAICLVDEYY